MPLLSPGRPVAQRWRRWRRTAAFVFMVGGVTGGAVSGAPQQPGTAEEPTRAVGDPIDYATARSERIARAVRITEDITLDGRLTEAAWEQAEPATNFIQWEPEPGRPSS